MGYDKLCECGYESCIKTIPIYNWFILSKMKIRDGRNLFIISKGCFNPSEMEKISHSGVSGEKSLLISIK